MEQKQIFSAFVKAQRGFAPALKTSTNPHFRSKYAALDACIEAVVDSLNDNGIALVQKTHEDHSGVTVETLFIHESGEFMSGGVLHVPAVKQDAQAYGSALSYARRYSLMAACGIAPEDDDGNAASKPKQATNQTRNDAKQADNSPKSRAARLVDGVKAGDAKNAALAASRWPEPELNAVWALLPPEIVDQLTAVWPGA